MELLLLNHYRQRWATQHQRNELASRLTSRQELMRSLYRQCRELTAYINLITQHPTRDLDLSMLDLLYENRWRILNQLSALRFEVDQLQRELTTLTPVASPSSQAHQKPDVSMSY